MRLHPCSYLEPEILRSHDSPDNTPVIFAVTGSYFSDPLIVFAYHHSFSVLPNIEWLAGPVENNQSFNDRILFI